MGVVLFGQAYALRLDPKLREAGQPYAPLGTLYAASVLREAGYAVALHDAMLSASPQEWPQRLDQERPAFAVLYEDGFNYLTKMCLERVRAEGLAMVAAARARGVPTIVSGSDVTDRPDVYLDAGATYAILGEGEATLRELLDALGGRSAASPDAIAGLAFRQGGAVVRTAPRPPLRDLDLLPRPAWDLVDTRRYRALWRKRQGIFSMSLATTRGCPYHCNWCAKPLYGQRYAVRRPEAVAAEVAWLRATYAPDHLNVVDDIFGLQPGWIEAFAEAVIACGAVTPFKCLSRADLLPEATVRALRAAGCRTVWIGAESGSQRILDAMEKGTRVEQIEDATRRLHAAGIEVGFFIQFGYPGETWDDIQQTRDLIRRARPDDIGISVSYPLPGTPFHARVEQQLRSKRHWTDSDDLAMLYRGPYPTEFYRALHRVVHAEFRLQRRGQSPAPRRASFLRRAASVAWNATRLPFARRTLHRMAAAGPS